MQHSVNRTFHEHVLRDVVIDELELRIAEKVSDIVGVPGQQIVEAQDVITLSQQMVAEMTPKESCPARDYGSFGGTGHFLPTP